MKNQHLYNYILGIADNCLILGQRLGELCGHGPSLETDIAGTNMSLDLLGQVRSYYQYAAAVSENDEITEDTIAFLRLEREYKNVLLVEQPNTDFGYTITRQAAIAKKSIKEVSYHWRFSSDWILRLGDGTAESKERVQEAIDELWMYTDELFHQTDSDVAMIAEGIGVDTLKFKDAYYRVIKDVLKEATLNIPENPYFHKGGKEGIHTEHMGYLLADMQYMQRTYPNMEW